MKNIVLYKNRLLLFCLIVLLANCSDDAYEIPQAGEGLQNDLIKRSVGPNVVGTTIDFAYAAAISSEQSLLSTITVESSIVGAAGTGLENVSYHTNSSGLDVGVQVGAPAVQEGNSWKVNFTTDTTAATLRYHYVIPEEARGQSIVFTFKAKAKDGKEISIKTEPYEISNMSMQLDLVGKDGETAFFSIEDMKWYNASEAVTKADKIDLIYLYRNLPTITFGHSLVSPSADPMYLPNLTLPNGVDRKSKFVKAWQLQDQQLARLQYGVYVDDVDLLGKSFTDAPDFAINLKAESGLWVETADGKYRAYIFINALNNVSKEIKVSIKRLTVK